MKFNQFVQEVKKLVKEYLDNEIVVEEKEVLKNNGVKLTGIVIIQGNQNCVPNIYLNDFYEDYKKGRTMEDIVYEIVRYYEVHKVERQMDMDFFTSYETVKDKLCIRLVNFARNEELLEQVPYIPYLDLAIVFYCIVQNEYIGNGSILVKNEHMKKWNIDLETLKQDAFCSVQNILKAEIKPMEDVICEMMNCRILSEIQKSIQKHVGMHIVPSKEKIEPIVQEVLEKVYGETKGATMYVVTNKHKNFGAVCILYDKLLEEFANQNQSDYYILPSSIHEVILVPIEEGTEELSQLQKMVREVNQTELEKEEVLSDCVYLYKRKDNRITIAENTK